MNYRYGKGVQKYVLYREVVPFSEGTLNTSLIGICFSVAYPIHCWLDSTEGVPVGVVKWVEHCPGLFLVLDTSSKLYIWSGAATSPYVQWNP